MWAVKRYNSSSIQNEWTNIGFLTKSTFSFIFHKILVPIVQQFSNSFKNTNAVRSGKAFEVRSNFAKFDRFWGKKAKNSGLFWRLKAKPKMLSMVQKSKTLGLIFEIFDHFLGFFLTETVDFWHFWKCFRLIFDKNCQFSKF